MWKCQMYALFTKRNPKILKKITDLFHFFQSLAKCLKKVLFDSLHDYFINNNLLTPCQSGFIKGDSSVNQLLAITPEIHKNLDANPSSDTIEVFLDMSKAFDKVWHNGPICKLQSYGIQSQLLFRLKNYLFNRKQSCYKWCEIFIETYQVWCSPRLGSWSPLIPSRPLNL